MRDAAAQFGVSDVGLKKICLRNDIQPPQQGHWQRVAAGEAVVTPPLGGSRDQVIEIYGTESTPEMQLPPDEEARLGALLEREALSDYQISVPANGTLHPMTKRIRQVLQASKPDDFGCLQCAHAELPVVRVTPQNLSRAIALLDAIVRAVEVRNFHWRPGKGDRWDRGARLEIEGVVHPFELYETTRRQHHRITPEEKQKLQTRRIYSVPLYDFVSVNQFSIRESGYQVYLRDSATKKLEHRLNDLMVILIKRSFRKREEERQRSLAAAKAAERAARREEIAKLRKVRADALTRLLEGAANWRKARDLRAFIAAVETRVSPRGSERWSQWVDWANSEADNLDPLSGDTLDVVDVDFEALRRLEALLSGS